MFKNISILLCSLLLLSGCITTSNQKNATDNAIKFMPYAVSLLGPAKLGSGGAAGTNTVLEYVPLDQEIGNWNKLVTVLVSGGLKSERYQAVLQMLGKLESSPVNQNQIVKKIRKTHTENTSYGPATYTEFVIENALVPSSREHVVSYVWPYRPQEAKIAKITLQKRNGELTSKDISNFKAVINSVKKN